MTASRRARIEEKAPTAQKLVDLLSEGTAKLVEGSGDKSGRIFVRGEFGRADKATANNRLYPPKIWESEIKRLAPNLKSRKVLGELDHPADGRTSLQRASHVITDIRLEDGRVVGEAEILDTQMGRDLKAIFAAGVPVGISSRGYGSVKENDRGESVVQEDYRLVTFDFVAEPADSTAYPEVFFEGVELDMPSIQEAKSEKEMADRFAAFVTGGKPGLAAADASNVKEQFASEFLSKIAEMKTQLRDQVRAEMMADPALGRARTAVDAIKSAISEFLVDDEGKKIIKERDDEIAALRKKLAEVDATLAAKDEMIEKLASAAKEAGYRFHMERLIGEDKDATVIRKQIGDVTRYASVKALTEAVSAVRVKLTEQRTETQKLQDALTERERKLQSDNAQLHDGLYEAMAINKRLALRLYAEERLTNHPGAEKIRAMLEHVQLESKEQIDALVDKFGRETTRREEDDLEAVRARVRGRVQSGRGPLEEDDTTARRARSARSSNYLGLGAPLGELKRLAGVRE